MKAIYTLCFAGLSVAACKSPEPQQHQKAVAEQTTESVIKPIAGLEIAPRIYTVSATEASRIELPNGGSIEFPENAFVDATGKPVKGEVAIEWKEFHSLTDILVSGIPMKYDSLGKEYDFVSGGMFDISATENHLDVFLANVNKATVSLASIDDTPCYNFYELDTKTGDWDYKTTQAGTPMPQQKKPGAAVQEQPAQAPTKTSKDFILDAQVNINACPELKGEPVVGWRVLDKISPKEQELLSKTPSESVLKPGENLGEYKLDVDMAKLKRTYNVQPYLLSEAKQRMQQNEVKQEKEYAEILAFQENVNSGKIIRSIEIENFGVFNWDRMCSRTELPYVAAEFIMPKNTNLALATVYFIAPDENLIVKWTSNYGNKLHFDPSKKNGIVAILPDNSVVAAGNAEFLKAGKLPMGTSFKFKMKETGIVLHSGKDIAKFLNELI